MPGEERPSFLAAATSALSTGSISASAAAKAARSTSSRVASATGSQVSPSSPQRSHWYSNSIGADAYCRDAAVAVETAKSFMAKRQGSALAKA